MNDKNRLKAEAVTLGELIVAITDAAVEVTKDQGDRLPNRPAFFFVWWRFLMRKLPICSRPGRAPFTRRAWRV